MELDKLKQARCIAKPLYRLEEEINNINMNEIRLNDIISVKVSSYEQQIKMLSAHLEALNPKAVLKRGYSIVYNENGNIVSKADTVKIGEKINIQTGNGTFVAERI